MPRRSKAEPAAPTSGIGRRRAAAKDDGSAAYQDRRAEIKDAAAALFKQHGFRGTSIGKVAESLGMDRATLYYYVGSKEELFDDVVTEAVRSNLKVAETIHKRPGSAPDKLHDLITSLMRSYADNYPFLYVFIQENLSHVGQARSDWSKEMRHLNKRYEDTLVSIIQAGIDEKTIRPVSEAWVMAYGLMGMVGWTNRWFNPTHTTHDAQQIGEAFADMILQGMLATD